MKSLGARFGGLIVVVAGVLGYKAFFVDSDEVVNFNDALVAIIEESDGKFGTFLNYLNDYSEGKAIDVDAMTAARDQLSANIQSDRDVLENIELPDDDACKAFHSACQMYVDNNFQIAEKYKDVIQHISEHNPAEDGDVDSVDALLAESLKKDDALFKAVGATQATLAEKFDLTIE